MDIVNEGKNSEIARVIDNIRKEKLLFKYLIAFVGKDKENVNRHKKEAYEKTMSQVSRGITELYRLSIPTSVRAEERKEEHRNVLGNLKNLIEELDEAERQKRTYS